MSRCCNASSERRSKGARVSARLAGLAVALLCSGVALAQEVQPPPPAEPPPTAAPWFLDALGRWLEDSKAKIDDQIKNTTDAAKDDEKFTVKRGLNEVIVTWKTLEPKVLDGMILWNGRGQAPRISPGDYPVTVTLGEATQSVVARIAKDPRSTATVEDLQARFRLARDCVESVTKAHEAIEAIRSLRTQMQAVVDRTEGEAKTKLEAKRAEVAAVLTAIEETLYQTKAKSSQDVLNFPIRLTDKLLGVMSAVDRAEFGPTVGQTEVAAALMAAIAAQLGSLDAAKKDGVAAFNALAHELAVPHVK